MAISIWLFEVDQSELYMWILKLFDGSVNPVGKWHCFVFVLIHLEVGVHALHFLCATGLQDTRHLLVLSLCCHPYWFNSLLKFVILSRFFSPALKVSVYGLLVWILKCVGYYTMIFRLFSSNHCYVIWKGIRNKSVYHRWSKTFLLYLIQVRCFNLIRIILSKSI